MNDHAFFFQDNSLVLPQGTPFNTGNLEIPLIQSKNIPVLDVFSLPKETVSGVFISGETPLPSFWQTIPVRQVISTIADYPVTNEITSSARMLRAFHIGQWRRESRFCGSCGGKNTDHGEAAARLCPACGRVEFPRISPAIITIITNNEGKALFAHNKKFTAGTYSLIAGFTEAGENLEETVAREVREEVGIEVRDIRYITSQPWPFPNSLMVGFSARYAGGTIRPDGVEIEDAQWFSRDQLPPLPGPGSVARQLIDKWLTGAYV